MSCRADTARWGQAVSGEVWGTLGARWVVICPVGRTQPGGARPCLGKSGAPWALGESLHVL